MCSLAARRTIRGLRGRGSKQRATTKHTTGTSTPLLCGDLVLDSMRIAEWAHR
jgi:hypothetical protein